MSNWNIKRVAFMISDDNQKITPVNVKMKVRVKLHTAESTTYEGPINSVWENKVLPRLDSKATDHLGRALTSFHLVGVLMADHEGRIGWLVQSEIVEVEQGAEV